MQSYLYGFALRLAELAQLLHSGGAGGGLIFGVVGGSVDSGSDRLSENVGFHGSVNHQIEWLSIWTLYVGWVLRLRGALSEAEGGVILAISEKTDV